MKSMANKRAAPVAVDDAEGSTAPSSPVAAKAKKTLSAEHLRRMRAGRKGAVSTQARSKLVFPVSLLRRRLAKDKFAPRASLGASVWLAGALETLVVEVLDGVVAEAERMRKKCVTSQHVMAALKNDDEFQRIFRNVTIAKGGMGGVSSAPAELLRAARKQPSKPARGSMEDGNPEEGDPEGGDMADGDEEEEDDAGGEEDEAGGEEEEEDGGEVEDGGEDGSDSGEAESDADDD